ncbi:MAG: helix-turn-helix transcriptional regulator [Clostridia bacterium]|nr:helix-turn-helix transcriptional regulator [Clostridia bacterium]
MDISSVNSDLIRGNVTTIILGSLQGQDRYGYEILKEIEDKSNGHYVLKQATLYNQLKRLEKQGLVSSYEGDPDDTGGGKRRYYALTKEGQAYLQKETTEYEYSRTILDNLLSSNEFDFSKDIPFDASELRPYAKRDPEEKPKVVYKDRVVEVEKPVETKIYLDRFGQQITEEEARGLALQAHLQDEEARELAKKHAQELDEKDETIRRYDKQLRQREDELRQADEDIRLAKQQLRDFEEEQRIKDEARRQADEEAKLVAEREAKRKVEQLRRPAVNLEEIFAKLDAESEYSKETAYSKPIVQEFSGATPQEHTYFNAYSGEIQTSSRSQSTLKDIFKVLDEKEAAIDDKNAEEQAKRDEFERTTLERQREYIQEREQEKAQPVDNEYLQSELENSPVEAKPNDTFAPSAVVERAEDGFDYEKSNVNYREFFTSIAEQEDVKPQKQAQPTNYDSDIKTRLYAKGFKIRPYDRGNTTEFYSFNFLQSNRIRRDTFLIILAFFLVEIAIMWVSLFKTVSYAYFLPILLVGAALCLVPSVIYLANPTRRIRANFNFKLSILNRTMLFIELTVVCILIGFFGLGATVNDSKMIICAIVLPMVLFTNLPLSSLIYWLLYRTHKYHIA